MSDSDDSSSSSDPCGIKAVRPDLFESLVIKSKPDEQETTQECSQEKKPTDVKGGLIDPSVLLASDSVQLTMLEAHHALQRENENRKRQRAMEQQQQADQQVESVADKQFALPAIDAHIPLTMFDVEQEEVKKRKLDEATAQRKIEEQQRRHDNSIKDREKRKRQAGQSSHTKWKSETEMKMRQQFD